MDLTSEINSLPTNCLRAIDRAFDKYRDFGNNWRDCIFGRAVECFTGSQENGCDKEHTVVQVFALDPAEVSAFRTVYRSWDNGEFTIAQLMKAVRTELTKRGVPVAAYKVETSLKSQLKPHQTNNNIYQSGEISEASLLEAYIVVDSFKATYGKIPAGDVVVVKQPAFHNEEITDAEIYAWINTFQDAPKEEVNA